MEVLRPRRSFVRRSGFRDARLIVIACEGSKTERIYFEELVASLVQRPSRVHVELLERDEGLSATEYSTMEDRGCEAVAELLRVVAGSASKSLTNAASYMPLVGFAVDRAALLDTNPELRWPAAPGSRVYQTVRSILSPLHEEA